MRRVEASQTISAPPETVFAFVADLANLPRWQSGIVSAEQTSPDPVGVGSTAHVVRELLGQRLAVDLSVTDHQPGRRLALASAASGIGVTAALELEPAAAGTLIRFAMEIRAQNMFMAPFEAAVAGAAASDLATSLEQLKVALERP
jgi:carbon monoxide dehydrogenase subunit G